MQSYLEISTSPEAWCARLQRGALAASLMLATLLAGCAASSIEGKPPLDVGAAAPVADPLAMLDHGLRPSLLQPGQAVPHWSLQERMAHYKVAGVAVALIRDGKLVAARGYGTREAGKALPVDADTLFSVGSVSKVVTATLALQRVAEGKLALDSDVNQSLKSWQLPPAAQFADASVTLRMLLSHTAGLSTRGFEDFQPDEAMPALLQILDGLPPAKNKPVRIEREPGLMYRYSGGGTQLVQLLVEENSGLPLQLLAQQRLFAPLAMQRSSFASPLPATTDNVAKAHDKQGKVRALPRGWESFPEIAASGLWTSANDLGRFVAALLQSYRTQDGLLPQPLARQMMTEVAPSVHGLGPRLEGAGRARVFHHGGDNDSYHARIEGYLESGDGFVILTNTSDGGAELRVEIRNALVDAIGLAVEPPLQIVALDLSGAAYADYAGEYRLDDSVPMEYRGVLTELFDAATITVRADAGRFAFLTPGARREQTLAPLATARFVAAERGYPLFEFHRDARGRLRGLSVSWGQGRAYYRREAAAPAG
ncbi:CubicO group peptidase (beta-lactamase class C family) [Tahibacter aquaticus]|uniref:CubicO group peptidase (Beta-lactamase class C family) n=1 Tax=Tahibacter aquaticus TaxID=520092 RepID=A0A4R6Z0M1_9GAMM|nr:serine hydrolase domain-containing protein [Tahibacter aquaticus]TDR45068.1 CubicO group peptidase (beta-lactamase class C family) [Tahibacter aquaticus]